MENMIRSIKLSVFLVTAAAFILLLSHKSGWAFGLAIGAAWSIANVVFTINILKIGVLKKDPAKLFALILLKFPVLYLTGFLILNSRMFPVASLLTGLMIVMATIGVCKLWLRQA